MNAVEIKRILPTTASLVRIFYLGDDSCVYFTASAKARKKNNKHLPMLAQTECRLKLPYKCGISSATIYANLTRTMPMDLFKLWFHRSFHIFCLKATVSVADLFSLVLALSQQSLSLDILSRSINKSNTKKHFCNWLT